MKKLICALIGVAALVASATTYIQTSSTGVAPWKPVKDSVSQAHLADSARVAWFAHAATYADSSRVSGLSDSAKRAETASWTPLSDSSLASGIADSAKKAGTTSNSLALGGVAADYFVQGSGNSWGVRTANLPGSSTALTQGLKSGFYDNDGTNGSGTPTGGWCHMVVNAHTNSGSGNQYQWELAAGFWDEDLYSRKINPGSTSAWRKLLHAGNYSSFNNFSSGLTTTTLTASGLITANGGIIGQGNVGSSTQAWNAGYFSTAGIDIGGGLLTFNSPSTSTALLGVKSHPMTIATATGAVTFPAGIGINGSLGLSVVSVGGTTYSASAHKGRILTIAPSTIFTLPLGSSGDWFIIQSADAQGQGQTAGKINPGGTTIYIRGIAYSSSVAVVGTLMAYCDGVHWYIG